MKEFFGTPPESAVVEVDPCEGYFITTPYVDAYDHDWEPERPKVTYAGFCGRMLSQASDWGEMGIGRAVTRGLGVPSLDGLPILAFGTFGQGQYVAVQDGKHVRVVAVPAGSIPDDWNVT